MADVGVVLRVPEVTHAKLKAACAKHDRSMQKVLVSLIEGWVANGAPEPSTYGKRQGTDRDQAGIDHEARAGLTRLGEAFKRLSDRVTGLEEETSRRRSSDDGMGKLFELIQEAEAKGGDTIQKDTEV